MNSLLSQRSQRVSDHRSFRSFKVDSSFKQTFLPMKRKPVSDLHTVSNSFLNLLNSFSLRGSRDSRRGIVENWKKFRKLHTNQKRVKETIERRFGEDQIIIISIVPSFIPLFFGGAIDQTELQSENRSLISRFDFPFADFPRSKDGTTLIYIKLLAACAHNNRASWRIQSELVFYLL